MTTELEQALEKMPEITLATRYVGENTREGWGTEHDTWRVTVRRGRRSYATDFTAGYGHRVNGQPQAPTLASVLACLLSDAAFCSDFGYDRDSRKALKTWNACRATARALDRVLGAETVEFLIGMEH